MKVGDGNNSSNPGDLLDRMREAHRQEEAHPVDEMQSVDGVDQATSTSGANAVDGARGSKTPARLDALEGRLLETAASALAGEFESTVEVRQAVVEAIVAERYADHLGPAQAEQITRTLTLTLTDDPVFRAEVDNMLLHAARELARRGD